MKLCFDFGRLDGWKSGAAILCLIVALVVGGGCGKSPSAPPPVASPPASDSASIAPGPAVTPPQDRLQSSVPSATTNAGPTQLQLLNRALLGWKMKNHRRPQTFEEFASTAGFQIPDPPAGKKYALGQNGFIVLVNSNQ